MFYLFVFALSSAAAEYFYFSQKLLSQRRQILTLTTENYKLKSKINKQQSLFSRINLKYSEAPYKYGFAMEHTTIVLLPIEDSPVVHKCLKSIRVNILYTVEVHSETWYEISITINNSLVKGYVRENGIKLIVEESC